MNVLVTGGAGYIGSHAVLRLLEDGVHVAAIDDFSRGNRGAIDALQRVRPFTFVEGDIGDRTLVAQLLRGEGIDTVMHFAAKAYVGESVTEPLAYYDCNTGAAIRLLQAMQDAGIHRMVFSSTCATYGEPDADQIPIRETCPQHPINPYGRSKLMVEQVLRDHAAAKHIAGEPFACTMLRYFNVAGSDPDARIGEDHAPETHLIPICLEVALGQREAISIFGTDYPTPDGTCIRDYVHVTDLIDAHVRAMDRLEPGEPAAYNVGVGEGRSVREVIDGVRAVTGVRFEEREAARRPGDPPELYAASSLIQRELGWTGPRSDLATIIADAWRWRQANPRGYATTASTSRA